MQRPLALLLVMVLAVTPFALSLAGAAMAEDEPPTAFRIHLTREDETMRDIASLPWTYGSRLMWPLVYYMNPEEISRHLENRADAPTTPLPVGLNLALLLPEESQQRALYLLDKDPRPWVINVRSVEDWREINGQLLTLIDEGYFAYITLYVTPEKRWKRLRIGFYASKEEAGAEGEKVKKVLGLKDVWITTANKDELLRFRGFVE
ncbi:MAG: SPOR domain-containing protein [Desulfatibacillaceae bacterium]